MFIESEASSTIIVGFGDSWFGDDPADFVAVPSVLQATNVNDNSDRVSTTRALEGCGTNRTLRWRRAVVCHLIEPKTRSSPRDLLTGGALPDSVRRGMRQRQLLQPVEKTRQPGRLAILPPRSVIEYPQADGSLRGHPTP